MATTIAIDPNIKKKASARAKEQDGLPISSVVTILLNEYIAGNIRIGGRANVTPNGFTEEFENEVLSSAKQKSEHVFKNTEDARAFLQSRI